MPLHMNWRKRWVAYITVSLAAACMLAAAGGYARADDIDWNEYSGNPVYSPAGGRAYYPCVVYDANQFSGHGESAHYKMWFGGYPSGHFQAVAYSDDGVNWGDAVEMQGITAGGYHAQVVYVPEGYSAAGGSYYYKIWYWDNPRLYEIAAIRTADSVDGVNWVNDQGISQDASFPLVSGLSGTDWKRGTYGPICVFHNPSATNAGTYPFDYTFAMYYDATTGGQEVAGLAYSGDGNHWTRYHQPPYEDAPVLDHGGAEDWDSNYSAYGTVVKESEGLWHFWYSGGQSQVGDGIGHATSTDGINWTRDAGNPLLYKSDGMAWRDNRTYTPSVAYSPTRFDGNGDSSRYKMWFTGRSSSGVYSVGYMSSNDPVPGLSLEKTASPAGQVTRGSVITYTIRMGNDGSGPATSAVLKDEIPQYTSYVSHTTTLNGVRVADAGGNTPLAAGMAVNSPGEASGVIAPGEEASISFMVQVGNDLPLGASISNTAVGVAEGVPSLQAGCVNGSSAQLPSTWYFAEGSTQPGFDEYILLSNMGESDMSATITYLTEGGEEKASQHLLPAHSRRTVYVNAEVPSENGVAAIVEGEAGLICERSMYYQHNGITGGDDVIGANAPSIDLFFAEGFTGTPESPFEEWLLFLNPSTEPSVVTVDYLFHGGETEGRQYTVQGRSRLSINVDREVGEGREVSARIRSELPIVAERSMYFVYNGVWPGGHSGMAATGARNDWYLAEGYTGWEGSRFDEWILVANENDQPAAVSVTYMFQDGGTRLVEHTAAARSRMTISADAEVGEGQMISAHVHSDVPIVVERAMYFSYRNAWEGGHNCLAASAPSSRFYFAEGYTGNSGSQFETWILIQNTADEPKTAVVDYVLQSGEVVRQELDLPAHSRSSIFANQVLDRESLEFSISVASKDGSPSLLAERAMYFSYMGSFGTSQGGHDVIGY